jgi:hypothetical protein
MNYITCNYQGRLGNLMFEIAAVLAAARDHNLQPCFREDYHPYYNDIPSFTEYILPLLSNYPKYRGNELLFDHVDEHPQLEYIPIVPGENHLNLRGYFTSSLYFNSQRQWVINFFRSLYQKEVREVYNSIRSQSNDKYLVSVHIRRTDYVTDYHWDLSLDYYKRAVESFSNDVVFVIFSDDHQWCRENLGFMQNKIFVSDKDYIELMVMGLMDAHIIANSTFSAMGVILGDPLQRKIVIAPEKWCPTLFNKNIYEPHWIIK